jgi:hypothetical protein
MKLRGLFLNFHIHVFVRNLYIPAIGPRDQYMNVELGERNYYSVLEIMRPCSFISGNTQNWNQTLYWILTGPLFAVHLYQQKAVEN